MIELYAHVDHKIAKVAESKMRLHLWYLSEDLAALALFRSNTTNADKMVIVDSLQRKPFAEDVHCFAPTKCSKFSDFFLAQFCDTKIPELICISSSITGFSLLRWTHGI